MKLSIIIPVYNVEQYLDTCLRSVLDQSLPAEEYEIIVVNDGSTDTSGDIADRYKTRYSEITVIHQSNGGLGNARNRGISMARGEYVLFLDSDDWLYPGSLPALLQELDKRDCDMVVFRSNKVWSSGEEKAYLKAKYPFGETLSGEIFINNYIIVGGICSYLFRLDMVKENNLQMPEGIYHEDELYITQALCHAQSIYFADIFVYAYRQGAEGSITTERNMPHLIQRMDDYLEVISQLIEFRKGLNSSKKQAGVTRKIDYLVIDILRLLLRLHYNKEYISLMLSRLKELGVYPLSSENYSFKYRIFRILVGTETSYSICRRLGASRIF